MRSGGSTWLLPARSFFIGCGAGLAAAAWNPTNVCPRLLCPLRSIVATLALPSCRHSCRSARVLRGHFGGPFCERACCLDSCLDSRPSHRRVPQSAREELGQSGNCGGNWATPTSQRCCAKGRASVGTHWSGSMLQPRAPRRSR